MTTLLSVKNLRSALTHFTPQETLLHLSEKDILRLWGDWQMWARDDQLPPSSNWKRWLILGGRGSGKTRTGAEHIRSVMRQKLSPIALIGETFKDVREVMIEGVSGIMNICMPHERPEWEAMRKRLVFPNGVIAQAFSAEEPESLRGPQFAYAWIDEFAKFRAPQEVMDMLSFGLRVGAKPRMVITTTPRPIAALKKLMVEKGTVITKSKTTDNASFLSPSFIEEMASRYDGTRLGRQELEGELIEDRAGALWTRALLDEIRIAELLPLKRVVVAVDPPITSTKQADKCGLVVVGLTETGKAVVVEDASQAGLKPLEWAAKAVRLYHKHQADCLVAEVNQGGEMVTTLLREVDSEVNVISARANRGKFLRAEPVAMLYQQGKVAHFGAFPELEDEMCDFTHEGLSNGRSPDRLDALVWGVTHLMMKGRAEPRVRGWG